MTDNERCFECDIYYIIHNEERNETAYLNAVHMFLNTYPTPSKTYSDNQIVYELDDALPNDDISDDYDFKYVDSEGFAIYADINIIDT